MTAQWQLQTASDFRAKWQPGALSVQPVRSIMRKQPRCGKATLWCSTEEPAVQAHFAKLNWAGKCPAHELLELLAASALSFRPAAICLRVVLHGLNRSSAIKIFHRLWMHQMSLKSDLRNTHETRRFH